MKCLQICMCDSDFYPQQVRILNLAQIFQFLSVFYYFVYFSICHFIVKMLNRLSIYQINKTKKCSFFLISHNFCIKIMQKHAKNAKKHLKFAAPKCWFKYPTNCINMSTYFNSIKNIKTPGGLVSWRIMEIKVPEYSRLVNLTESI